jgi:hypothetical protein
MCVCGIKGRCVRGVASPSKKDCAEHREHYPRNVGGDQELVMKMRDCVSLTPQGATYCTGEGLPCPRCSLVAGTLLRIPNLGEYRVDHSHDRAY